MKNWLFYFVLLSSTVFISCQNEKAKNNNVDSNIVNPDEPPVMAFEETAHDFGKISEGEKVKHTFYFTNTGKSPLYIHSAEGSCGCTVPVWTKEPIQPGEEGQIEVSFNSEKRNGHQEKAVTILANTKPTKNFLKITADVIVAEKKSEK